MRGIIADCRFSGDSRSLSISTGIDPMRLRQYLLYWDKIDYPINNIIHIGFTPEEEYLQDIGVLQRSQFQIITGTDGIRINPEIFIACQLRALEINNQNKDEIWSIGQNSENLILPSEKCVLTDTAQLQLYNCIPAPSENTPFDDILDFKERRKDELMEFRRVMDEMSDKIVNSFDQELQIKRCIEELQNRIIDINRLMDESCIKRILSGVSVEFNISDLGSTAISAGAGYLFGEKVGFPELGAVVGLVSSAISIKYSSSLKPVGLPDNLKDYAYLFHAKQEILK